MGAHEHRGGNIPNNNTFSDFVDWINLHNLVDINCLWAIYTWSNGRTSVILVEIRLDRVLCNQYWLTLFQNDVFTLHRIKSGHFPIVFELSFNNLKISSQLKFHRIWTLNDSCHNMIQSCWNSNIVGFPMYVLNKKLKLLKSEL